jgi:hypothetical protein
MSRSIYLVLPDWHGDPDDVHESVVETLWNGPTFVKLSRELWRLADREDRAAKIEEVLGRAYEHDDPVMTPVLNTEEIREFYDLLDGLDDALKESLLDDKWQIPPERIEEVRRRTQLLDLDDLEGHRAREGVSEGLSQVHGLRAFLKEALDRGLYVALD